MNYFKYYYILIIFFNFISCELEVEIDVPIPDPKLSASCFFTDYGEWYVHVSKSKFILDTVGFDLITDANVEIYENNNLIETLEHIGNGWYSTIRPIGLIAIVGATGLVGTVMLKILEERNFPVKQLIPVASERSIGKEIKFKSKKYNIAHNYCFNQE